MSDQSLIPIESINAVEIFTGGGLDALLSKIRDETAGIVPNVGTVSGRKEIASIAYKIARSKTTIDEAGKVLVSEWKKQSGEVDAARKKARDYLDALRDEVRKPLDDYEAEQARIERERLEAIEQARLAEEANARAELERREAELRAREEAIAKAEREVAQKAAEALAESERIAREDQIRKDAEDRSRLAALEAIANAERKELEAKEAARLAAEKAIADQQEAVRQAELRAKQEAEAKERERLDEEARIRAEDERRSADRQHRKEINNAALNAFVEAGIDCEVAKHVIAAIAMGNIPNVSIKY